MKWTDDQQKAIDGRKGTLLVSAAAGSGKTATLTERIIQRITVDNADISNMLIVTFTRSAAALTRIVLPRASMAFFCWSVQVGVLDVCDIICPP